MVITSPNMDYVPEWPIERSTVETYSDGRWGIRKYSLLPQDLCHGMWHTSCIPAHPDLANLPSVLRETLQRGSHWEEDTSFGMNGLGYINLETRVRLTDGANLCISRWEKMKVPHHVQEYGAFLVMILRQVLSRMRNLPAVTNVAIAVAAHVQRVSLELAGLRTYMETVVPRLESSKDYSVQVLPVVGAFVRDATDAQTCTRVGLPIWLLQPLTRKLAVWSIVECSPPPYFLSLQRCNPPIVQEAHSLVGVSNLTGSWHQSMLLAVSKQVVGTHLCSLSLAEVPRMTDQGPPAKRARIEQRHATSTELHMRPVELRRESTAGPSKARKHRKRGSGKGRDQTQSISQPSLPIPATPETGHGPSCLEPPVQPAKTFVPSPFYEVPSVWERALRAASPVGRSNLSALYFYPPPFLLDTVSKIAVLPIGIMRGDLARVDHKVHRYIHNLARIRPFLRVRILDPSLTNQPLSIAQWRAALWGDYSAKEPPDTQHAPPSAARMAQRRWDELNGVVRLFARVAQLRSYNVFEPAAFEGGVVNTISVVFDIASEMRRKMLWEAHEINFLAEVVALDTVLAQTHTWSSHQRWQREAEVSTIWGPPSSVVSVIPQLDEEEDTKFRWTSLHSNAVAVATTHQFIRILMKWPGCPAAIAKAAVQGVQNEDFGSIQELAVDFYVRSFVHNFCRLPIPPILFPQI